MPLLTSVSDSRSFGRGGAPVFGWVTSTALNVVEGTTSSITFTAVDPLGGSLTYSLISGTFPTGTTFNSNGTLTGTFPNETSDTLYPVTIRATSSLGPTADKTFDLTVRTGTVSWTTAEGNIGSSIEGSAFSQTVEATTNTPGTISYAVTTGSLPSGLSLNSSTGAITGTAPAVGSDTDVTFSITATDTFGSSASRSFTITTTNGSVSWVTAGGSLGSANEGSAFSNTVSATTTTAGTISYSVTSGSLPGGLSLNGSTGAITGTASEVGSDTESSFTLTASDTFGNSATRDFTITVTGPTLPSNENKITASDGAAFDRFGFSVAVGSGRIVFGAIGDDNYRGSAYIFDLDGTQLTKITASDRAAGDEFGVSVAVGNDRIVVGAYGDNNFSGSAYIFDLDGTQLAKITASDGSVDDRFAERGLAIGNGRIVVGAHLDDTPTRSSTGSAYIFDLDGNELAKITASDASRGDIFGISVAVGNDRIVVGASQDDDNGRNSGSAYIFDLDGTQLAKITASDGAANDFFGRSVAVGNGRIVVGAGPSPGAVVPGDPEDPGSAYIFDLDGNELVKITASDGAAGDQFGVPIGGGDGLAIGNGRIVVGAYRDDDNGSDSGSAYIYETPNI